MADVHDSYDAVLADVQDQDVQVAIPELEVTSPATKDASPTKTTGSGNEFTVEDEGDFDATGATESAATAIQPPFASLERFGVQISTVPAEILGFFREFDRVTVSLYCPQHFWVFGEGEADFYGYSVPCDGVQFLEAMWKKCGNFISRFKLGIFVGGAMLTLLCCVLAQMRNTHLEDVTETKILEWKSVMQELI
uniref:Uncharacterized protein n=1 Tax=Fagus sylvatica TaxID=28930 RepID=A0A2N9H386_FAGSY